jgi:hypothetical protein
LREARSAVIDGRYNAHSQPAVCDRAFFNSLLGAIADPPGKNVFVIFG